MAMAKWMRLTVSLPFFRKNADTHIKYQLTIVLEGRVGNSISSHCFVFIEWVKMKY
jgi:hypothetical protein